MNEIKTIITSDTSGKALVDFAKRLGEQLAKSLKTNQIRKIFTEVRKIEALWERKEQRPAALRRLLMLKPKLAYQEKRQERKGNSPVKPLSQVLVAAIDIVAAAESPEAQDIYFKRFVEFFEAVLAYHKFYGGKDN